MYLKLCLSLKVTLVFLEVITLQYRVYFCIVRPFYKVFKVVVNVFIFSMVQSISEIKFKKLLYCCSITVVCIFPTPLLPISAKPTSLPYFHPPPGFCPCVLYCSSWKPFPPLAPPPSPPAIVRLFLISMSLVIFCLLFSFVDYVPLKGEIIWYLSITTWFISLSIMLSSSTHAVAKGISSFFLSAA